jgi:hypothetical protein
MSAIYGRPSNLVLSHSSYRVKLGFSGYVCHVLAPEEIAKFRLDRSNGPRGMECEAADGSRIFAFDRRVSFIGHVDILVKDTGGEAVGRVTLIAGMIRRDLRLWDVRGEELPVSSDHTPLHRAFLGTGRWSVQHEGVQIATMNRPMNGRVIDLDFQDIPEYKLDRRLGLTMAWLALTSRA